MFSLGRFLRIPGPWFLTRWVRRIAVGLAAAYLAGTFLQVWFAAGRDDAPTAAEAIVVLGAAQYNGRPSPVLRGRSCGSFPATGRCNSGLRRTGPGAACRPTIAVP